MSVVDVEATRDRLQVHRPIASKNDCFVGAVVAHESVIELHTR